MEKFLKNIIIYIGLILCILVFVLNITLVSKLYLVKEIISQRFITITKLLTVGIVALIIISLSKLLNKIKVSKSTKKIIFTIIIICYIIMQVFYIFNRMGWPVSDQRKIYNAAIEVYNNGINGITDRVYFEIYPHQLTLLAIYVIIFKVFHTTNVYFLQILNAVANALSLIAVVLIANQLTTEYKINKVKTVMLFLLFVTLPFISIFVYGDLLSFPMCLFAIYFIIEYNKKNKKWYALISSIFMAIACMERMNCLIFVIAIAIYMVLDILKNKKENKKIILKKILILTVFITVSIVPAKITKAILQKQLGLDNKKAYPTSGWIYMGMENGNLGGNTGPNGWFNGEIVYGEYLNSNASQKYIQRIKSRLTYFVNNPLECLIYYLSKTNSMWTENTYSAIWYNITEVDKLESETKKQKDLDNLIINLEEPIIILQKAVVLIIFGKTILVIMQNKNKLTNEALLLLLVFVGGFLFQTIWEAKSRYIIPYILVLMPLASIEAKNILKIRSKK